MLRKHLLLAVSIAAGFAVTTLWIGARSAGAAGDAPTPIGAWFGIARPCTPPGGPAHPTVNQAICRVACKGPCPTATFPVSEVTMIPTLLADGTVLADDFGAVGVSPPGFPIAGDGHTTAHGKWAFQGKVRIDGAKVDRYQATFIWFQGRPPGFPYNAASPVGFFHGSVRPRFVTFFDKKDPDVMVGFIQPYLYNYTDANGIVSLQDGTAFPTPDPVAPLPAACDPSDFGAAPYCLGTLQFTIRRIRAE
ncbi:MAG TPA: hypothetical protein VK886_05750 [Vicinamibacterales bacterium]|nr:hypothetical protein [Vicinamibacterales bacterium]